MISEFISEYLTKRKQRGKGNVFFFFYFVTPKYPNRIGAIVNGGVKPYQMNHPHIETVAAASLIPNPKNARTHSPKQVSQLSVLIKKFGWLVPIIIDDNNMIVAGHGRLLAAKKLGQKEVPVMEGDLGVSSAA